MSRPRSNFIPCTRTDKASGSVTYIGRTFNGAALTSDPSWQIERISIEENEVIQRFADKGSFDNTWDNRVSLFPPVPSINNNSLNFDGNDEYIDFGDNYAFGPAQAFSWSFWIKPQNLSAQRALMSKSTNDASVFGYMIYHNSNGKIFVQMRASGTNRQHTFNTVLTAGVWQNIVITYDGSSNINGLKSYVNGAIDISTPASGTLNPWTVTEPLKLGRRSSSFHFSGNMNQVSVWDKELSQSDVTEIYNEGVPGNLDIHGSKLSRLSWWKLNIDTNFPTELDQAGNIDGTLVSMEAADYVPDVP